MLVISIFSFFPKCMLPDRNFIFFGHIYFLVCKCFKFEQVQYLVFWKRVNPFPNTPFWDRPKFKDAADDSWLSAFSPFFQNVCFLTEILFFLVTFIFWSANALNLNKSNILSFEKELTHSLTHHFETVLNSKTLQTTAELAITGF